MVFLISTSENSSGVKLTKAFGKIAPVCASVTVPDNVPALSWSIIGRLKLLTLQKEEMDNKQTQNPRAVMGQEFQKNLIGVGDLV